MKPAKNMLRMKHFLNIIPVFAVLVQKFPSKLGFTITDRLITQWKFRFMCFKQKTKCYASVGWLLVSNQNAEQV